MPIVRKLSEKAKKKLQHQLYLARESPDLVFDVAGCELSELPTEVFSLCKVLQKETLLLHTNNLTAFDKCGPTSNLLSLRILDIHSNELTHLPADIGCLINLQVLNVDHNKIKELPPSTGKLQALQTLSAVDNRLTAVPEYLCDLKSLRTLALSQNKISRLPRKLCNIRTLESLSVDSQHMVYPAQDLCAQGIEAIMKFLCKENGVEYIAPSSALLPVLPSPSKSVTSAAGGLDQTDLTSSVLKYENMKEKKRLEFLELERGLAEDKQRQAQLLAGASANQIKLLQIVSEEQEKVNAGLTELQLQKEQARNHMVQLLQAAETRTLTVVNKLLDMSEKARRTEELLDQMERDRNANEQWFRVRQEEIDHLRKKDVLVAMQHTLMESMAFDGLLQQSRASRENLANETLKIELDRHGKISDMILAKQYDQKFFLDNLMKEENLQKEAVEMLLMQRDSHHSRVRGHIALVERELAQLTLLEVEQRQLRANLHMNVLAEKRLALTQLLVQLLTEKDKREVELHKRLCEMEAERLANQFDYWLVQYQRLMDSKPAELAAMENQLDVEVVQLLEWSGTLRYVSVFAKNCVTIDVLLTLTDDDLRMLGVEEASARRALVREVARYIDSNPSIASTKRPMRPQSVRRESEDGGQPVTPVTPTAPLVPGDISAHGLNSECAICMNAQSAMVFLPCGHVCSCVDCSRLVTDCPLCRASISQKVRIFA